MNMPLRDHTGKGRVQHSLHLKKAVIKTSIEHYQKHFLKFRAPGHSAYKIQLFQEVVGIQNGFFYN